MMRYIILICLSVCISNVMHAQFSGKGTGTDNDPYQITNADELFEVRNDLSASYKLMNDIDLKQWIEEDNPTQGWNPIGNENTPFKGNFDGNNKVIKGLYIKRNTMDNIGLFGYITQASIKNLALIMPRISGQNNVGGLVGNIYFLPERIEEIYCSIEKIVIIGGNISGTNYIGGIVGKAEAYGGSGNLANINILGCYNSSLVKASDNYCGGICGRIAGCNYRYGASNVKISVCDNLFMGNLVGKSEVGGVTNSSAVATSSGSYSNCLRNIGGGTIKGESYVGGILGHYQDVYPAIDMVKYNVSLADTINASSSPYRISNYAWPNNFAYSGTIIYANGKQITVEDNDYNGVGYGLKILKKQSTYEGMGFDFSNQWAIVEGETFPYNKKQSTPPVVTSFTAGSKGTVSGTAIGSGTIYVLVGNDIYESYILDNKWSVTLGSISKGTAVKVIASLTGLLPSIPISSIAVDGGSETPDILQGDANGDGVVDAADVVAIVNYILGKASSSFVKANSDLNGDGNILVDDAVMTVQLVLDK